MTRRTQLEAQLERALVEHLRWGACADTWRTHIPNGGKRSPPEAASALKAFKLRCWARAELWAACEFDLHEGVDELQAAAERDGIEAIGQDAVQAIMRDAFHRVRGT